jgi:histidyl-tRNA synthetase
MIGIGSPMADVEMILLSMEVLRKLGLNNIELRLSHAGLTRGIIQKLGLKPEEQTKMFAQLLDGNEAVLTWIKAEKPELAPLLGLQGKSAGFVKNLTSTLALDIPDLKPQIDDMVFITNTLEMLNCGYQIDIASVRGFEYYTGIIFQLFVDGEKVGGGGRYDALIPAMGGKDTAASGFALYMDLLARLIRKEMLLPVPTPRFMLKLNQDAYQLGFAMADLLRNVGCTVKLHLGGKGPSEVDFKLEVRQDAPSFVITDYTANEIYELNTSEEVLEKLGK